MFDRFETVVRRSKGPLYTTIWASLDSFKAIRLGPRRYQRCPVGHDWAMVSRVNPDELSESQRAAAAAVRDVGLP